MKLSSQDLNRLDTHVVTALERPLHVRVHVVVVERHKQRVDHDAERDEQLDERVEHDKGHPLLELEPHPAAVPHAEDVDHPHPELDRLVLERRTVLVVVLCGEVVNRD